MSQNDAKGWETKRRISPSPNLTIIASFIYKGGLMALIETLEKPKTTPVFVPTRPRQVPPLGESLLSRIGNTPLVPLHRIAAAEEINPNVVVFAKAEWFNASGSVKARPALFMMKMGERVYSPPKKHY
jgi:hypothetical protein